MFNKREGGTLVKNRNLLILLLYNFKLYKLIKIMKNFYFFKLGFFE